VQLRRAVLLFAIVLGLAAVAASVSRTGGSNGDGGGAGPSTPAGRERPPTAAPAPAPAAGDGLAELTFAADRRQVRRLTLGRGATLLVEVDEPGQVEIPGLGVSAPAEPLTPARFELFASEPGRHAIFFLPAAGEDAREVGTLVIGPARG
jgi:hypothetical protein